MKSCVYDNPVYMRREIWMDGVLLRAYTFELLHTVDLKGKGAFFKRPWCSGEIIGDKKALDTKCA